jgi:hypothetical protein
MFIKVSPQWNEYNITIIKWTHPPGLSQWAYETPGFIFVLSLNPIQAGGGGMENTPNRRKSLILYYLLNKRDFLLAVNSVLSILA